MIRNYLTVAGRRLRRHVTFSLLNVIGLAAGLACVLLIGLWVEDELSYDDFHPNADRTYRVLRDFDSPRLDATITGTPSALAPALDERYSQVQATVRIELQDHLVEHGNQKEVEPNTAYADPGFFDIFGVEVQRGAARLSEPGTVMITPALAEKYFPNTDPVGQTLSLNEQTMEVTGIVEPPPSNTHLDYSLVASLATRSPSPNNWGQNFWRTYVTLQPGTSASAFESTVEEIIRSYRSQQGESELPERYLLQPITGIHLGLGAPSDLQTLENEDGTGSITYVYLFSALAVFVLLLACINFMNLSTARSAQRANEVGVRKAMGAGREQLAGQFLGESFLITTLALLLAIAVCAVVLPVFNDLAGKSIAASTLVSGPHLLAYAGLVIVVGAVAGSYPALVLSGYQPIETLRAQSSSTQGNPRLRQGLVVFQFAISIALIAGTAVVHQQVNYLQSKDLGFQEENMLVLNDESNSLQGQREAFKQELEVHSSIESATSGFSVPGSIFSNTMWTLDRPEAEPRNADYSDVGYEYVETLGIEMVAGRDFSRDHPSDTMAVLINEAAVEEFGFSSPQDAIGEAFVWQSSRKPIVGVVENFHYESLHEEIYPLILRHEDAVRASRYVATQFQSGQETTALEAVQGTWQNFSDLPLEYSFLADDLAAQYEAEQRLQRLFTAFAGLAILIACLGLFGLAAYAAQQRRKEIGIRKALGATVSSIIGLLSRNFLALVGLAFVVATPIAYLALRHWLQNFPYRIDLHLSVFALAGGLSVAIAAFTVSAQAWHAARTDPAQVLRQE